MKGAGFVYWTLSMFFYAGFTVINYDTGNSFAIFTAFLTLWAMAMSVMTAYRGSMPEVIAGPVGETGATGATGAPGECKCADTGPSLKRQILLG